MSMSDLKDWVQDQPKARIFMAILILCGIVYVIFGFGYGKDYHNRVNTELEIAKFICENSQEYVQKNPERLKLGKANLKNFAVDGERFELKYVKYPQVIFLESGFSNIDRSKTARDIFCTYSDPRDSTADYYYNYEKHIWQDKIRFRR